ncbi:MAG: hypothetical protein HY238_17830 [Acidobacteria bacterium]|nr:hypothetical protein [Acidobacteriota bacterium]
MLANLMLARRLFGTCAAVPARTATTTNIGLLFLLLGMATLAQAQIFVGPVGPFFASGFSEVYSAKFVCGTLKTDGPVLRGTYTTTINVHNPNYYPRLALFRKKVSLTYPAPQQKPGPVSQYRFDMLETDQSLQIDCADIASFLPSPTPLFYEGFVVIESQSGVLRAGLILFLPRPLPLDVVAVYTARPSEGQVESIHIQQFPSRTEFVTSPILGINKALFTLSEPTFKLAFAGPPNRPVRIVGFQDGKKSFEGLAGNTNQDGVLVLTGAFVQGHIGKWRIHCFVGDDRVEGNELESNPIEFEVAP